MAGGADAGQGDADAASDLDREHGQGDRDADATVEDGVEHRVLGVVVVVLVAVEPLGSEELCQHPVSRRRRAPCREVIEPAELRADVELRVCVRGDEERHLVEGHCVRRPLDQQREALRRLHVSARAYQGARRHVASQADGRRSHELDDVVRRHREECHLLHVDERAARRPDLVRARGDPRPNGTARSARCPTDRRRHPSRRRTPRPPSRSRAPEGSLRRSRTRGVPSAMSTSQRTPALSRAPGTPIAPRRSCSCTTRSKTGAADRSWG